MANFSKTMSYKMLDKTSSIAGDIKRSIKEYTEVDHELITSQILSMENNALNKMALKLVQGGRSQRIQMMTATSDKFISTAMPFATYKSSNGTVTNAYIDNVGRVSGSRLVGASEAVFSLLGSAAIANTVFDDYGPLTHKDLMIPLMNVYVDMVIGVFNVLIHTRSDKKLLDVITYASRKFFLECMLNISDDSVNDIAIKGLNNIDQSIYEKIKNLYESSDITVENGLEKWLQCIEKISPRSAQVNKKVFIEKWIRQYGEYAYFAMDNVEYLIWAILGSLAFIPGLSRQLQVIIKNSKTITKLRVALFSFNG
jgi:hypothetical protein